MLKVSNAARSTIWYRSEKLIPPTVNTVIKTSFCQSSVWTAGTVKVKKWQNHYQISPWELVNSYLIIFKNWKFGQWLRIKLLKSKCVLLFAWICTANFTTNPAITFLLLQKGPIWSHPVSGWVNETHQWSDEH